MSVLSIVVGLAAVGILIMGGLIGLVAWLLAGTNRPKEATRSPR